MVLSPGPTAQLMLVVILLFAPLVTAFVYGIALCVRDSERKSKTARLVGIAVALLIAGLLPYYLLMLMSRFGWRIPPGFMSIPFLIVTTQPLFLAAGLALLFRAAFLDETPAEYDPGPPVYRNDDGPPAEG